MLPHVSIIYKGFFVNYRDANFGSYFFQTRELFIIINPVSTRGGNHADKRFQEGNVQTNLKVTYFMQSGVTT